MATLEHLIGWDFAKQRPRPGGGVFGVATAFAFSKEWQKRGTPHAHGLVHLLGMANMDALKERIAQDPEAMARFWQFAQSVDCTCAHGIQTAMDGEPQTNEACHRHGHADTDNAEEHRTGSVEAADLYMGPDTRGFAVLRPVKSTHDDFEAIYRNDVAYHVQREQQHICNAACLVKNRAGDGWTCKRKYPKKVGLMR